MLCFDTGTPQKEDNNIFFKKDVGKLFRRGDKVVQLHTTFTTNGEWTKKSPTKRMPHEKCHEQDRLVFDSGSGSWVIKKIVCDGGVEQRPVIKNNSFDKFEKYFTYDAGVKGEVRSWPLEKKKGAEETRSGEEKYN